MSSDRGDEAELTATGYVVLGLVAALGEATSYDLKQAAQVRVGGFWAFPHSQLYAEPQRLARLGFLDEQQEPSGRRRRRFRITPEGREALRRWLDSSQTRPMELRDEGLLKLAFAGAAGDDALRALARDQQRVHRSWRERYDAMAADLPPEGDTRFARATLEMGRRYRRLAEAFWADVERLADERTMPTAP